ncbi:torsin-1A-interacting protein 2-like [Portunus trituberculatus]|uniref:torsin-1A-interacting protein 2-like n=1 Tax=Portunus trituberculatus TaxID=210409 RepID=UPI001E1CB0A9|nr:torsin-1A-interacting protein 2-like [Portunus trituberculatus]XP_045106857.1 torsin-1A-interacting protein 2-like [Portunus trituberculatus]XP_045106858.1 torsin-1A-interacting protein 2-like [Portunus trituberculatus]XP_045106859.1 torsin-1A-interacting protein 2-like [Portunus trituberculatus]
MPQRRKDCGFHHSPSQPSHGHRRDATPPPPGSFPDHKITNEVTKNTSDDESNSTDTPTDTTPTKTPTSSRDLLDGTTQRHPLGTPPETSTTSKHQPRTSPHTSGQTQCRLRPNTSPGKESRVAPEEGLEKAKHHQGPTPALLILVVFLILLGIYSLQQAISKAEEEKLKKPPKPIADIYADLKRELQSLSREFSQPREVWLGLLGQLEAVMVEEPLQPAVILFVVPDDSQGVATCLSHRLARAVQYAFEDSQFVMYDTRTSEYLDSSALLKVELDETLRMLERSHGAVIHNLESIPGPAAMILHAYCDNENAPYKQAILILLVEVPGTYKDLGYSRRLDTLVDAHLGRLWGAELAEKDVSALISRTCNTPVLIRPEKPEKVSEMCPL